MILLAEWASFRKSNAQPQVEVEDVSGQDDDGSVADIVMSLVDNLQMASRQSQAAKVRSEIKTKLDDLTVQVINHLQADLEASRLTVERQLKALFSPLLNERLEAKAVEDFCHGLTAAIGRDTARHVVILAPPELQDRLAAKLAQSELDTSIVLNEGEEVSTSLEATEITTEIGRWKADLQRLLS